MTLTQHQLQSLESDGYVVVESALDRAWVARLLGAFEDAPPQADGTQHVRVTDTTKEREAWLALASHPLITAATSVVLGRPFRVDMHGRNPLSGGGQQGLHADWPPRGFSDPFYVVTALWMLDEFTAENGATRVVPGSHKLTRAPPKSLTQPLARHRDEVIITGPAGSVLLLNGHLWHSGRRNETAGARRAVQMVLVAHDGRPAAAPQVN